jgi:hypothetical protein
MAESMLDLGQGLELWSVHVDELREQDVNARSMPPSMFERLQATIAKDGRLEALPLIAQIDGGLEIVSGHHRIRAARAAEVGTVHVLVDVTGLTRDQIAAKQLAHNAIEGTDEAQLIEQIFQSILDVDARLESFIDPTTLDMGYDKVSLPNLDLDIEYRTTLLTFLPSQEVRFQRACEQIVAQVDMEKDALGIADRDLYERWRATMRRLGRDFDARALTTVIMRLLDAASELLGLDSDDPAFIDPDGWVPLAEIFTGALVPPEVGEVLHEAVERMVKQGDVTERAKWRAIELWAADYLAGP